MSFLSLAFNTLNIEGNAYKGPGFKVVKGVGLRNNTLAPLA